MTFKAPVCLGNPLVTLLSGHMLINSILQSGTFNHTETGKVYLGPRPLLIASGYFPHGKITESHSLSLVSGWHLASNVDTF